MNSRWTWLCSMGIAAFLAAASSFGRTNVAAPPAPQASSDEPANGSDTTSDGANPYAIITDRNVFRLNPPPPPPVAEVKPVDLPKIYLNGFVKIRDSTHVLFSIPPKDAKEQTAYYSLAPGEKQGILELVKIHPEKQEVEILNSGTAMTLSINSNNPAGKGGGGPAPSPVPGFAGMHRMPGIPPSMAPRAAAAPAAIVAGGNDGSASPYGGVTVAGGGGGASGNNSSYGGGVTVAGGSQAGGASSVPNQIANALFSQQPANTQIGNPVTQPTSPDIQAANLLIHHTQYGANSPPLPPPLAAMIGEGSGNQGGGPPVPGGGGPPIP